MLKKLLSDGKVVYGIWVMSGSPTVAEVMVAGMAWDFLVLDAEHGPIDLPQAHNILGRVVLDVETLVRIENGGDYWTIKRYMDAGATGVIVPRVENEYQMQAILNAAYYPPKGKRGLGYARSNLYGRDIRGEFEHSNDDVVVIPQIESRAGIRNLVLILEKGPDAAMIGPWDLTADMGIPGQWDRNEYITTLDWFLDTCKEYKVAPGIHIAEPDAEEALKMRDMGFRFIAYGMDVSMLTRACVDGYRKLRGIGK